MTWLATFGRYCLFIRDIFHKPEKGGVYYRQTLREIMNLCVSSIGIVAVISFFIGAVITIQTAQDMENQFLPRYLIGVMVRDTVFLEFSSSIIALILAGTVGSSIASEIGTMRITEQIDALEIMGVNPPCYLVLPKIFAALVFFPILALMSMGISIIGGWVAGVATGVITSTQYIYGLRFALNTFFITYSFIKMIFYAFIIVTVPSFYAYNVQGGSVEVGKASTHSVVWSSILILAADLVLTQTMLG